MTTLNIGQKNVIHATEAVRHFDYYNAALGASAVDIPLSGGGIDTAWCIYNATNKRMEVTRAGKYAFTVDGFIKMSNNLTGGGTFHLGFFGSANTYARILRQVNGSNVVVDLVQNFTLSQYFVANASALTGDATYEPTGATASIECRYSFGGEFTLSSSDYVELDWLSDSGTHALGINGTIRLRSITG